MQITGGISLEGGLSLEIPFTPPPISRYTIYNGPMPTGVQSTTWGNIGGVGYLTFIGNFANTDYTYYNNKEQANLLLNNVVTDQSVTIVRSDNFSNVELNFTGPGVFVLDPFNISPYPHLSRWRFPVDSVPPTGIAVLSTTLSAPSDTIVESPPPARATQNWVFSENYEVFDYNDVDYYVQAVSGWGFDANVSNNSIFSRIDFLRVPGPSYSPPLDKFTAPYDAASGDIEFLGKQLSNTEIQAMFVNMTPGTEVVIKRLGNTITRTFATGSIADTVSGTSVVLTFQEDVSELLGGGGADSVSILVKYTSNALATLVSTGAI